MPTREELELEHGLERERRSLLKGSHRKSVDLSYEFERIKRLRRHVLVRYGITLVSVVCSALLQAYVIKAFVQPAGLLSSGFTGLAILIDRATSQFGLSFPTFAGMVALNIPVALMCWKDMSRRFVCFSMLQVMLASAFLRCLDFEAFLNDRVLQVVFGGFLYGLSVALVLRGGASTAGTDFVSLMVSNRTGRSAWGMVFAGNCVVLCAFGMMFGWTAAAYSIIFQFISTKSIETFYHRYDRMTMQIVTTRPSPILDAYSKEYRHGSSCVEALGGYSRERYWVITTVVSSYEVEDIAHLARVQDEHVVINVFRTERFYGGFYREPVL